MKAIISRTALVLTVLMTGMVFTACSDDDVTNIDLPDEPRRIRIGFGLELEQAAKAENTINHNYITTGYNVIITGGVENGQVTFENVDLNSSVEFDALGNIAVTVVHPDFVETKVDTKAFFGVTTDEFYAAETNVIDLELVQGFVMVTTAQFIKPLIGTVTINSDVVNLDTVYYTAASNVEVSVEARFGGITLTGSHETVIGEGKQYNVISNGGQLEFTFPEFGDPGNGDLDPN